MDNTTLFDLFQRMALAIAIGFLVGVERGWKQRDEAEGERAAGLRTFTLAGLLGGLAGLSLPYAGALFAAAIALAFMATIITFEVRASMKHGDASATSSVAALVVFLTGIYAVVGEQAIAAALGVGTAAVLAFKQGLHAWVRRLTWPEIRSAILILAATFIALPVLPDQPVDPWGLVEPRSLWMLTIFVAGASFAGYVALRVLGPDAGLMASALAGAVVSSTAVTLDLARRVRRKEANHFTAASAICLATLVSLSRVLLFVGTVAAPIAIQLAPALGAAGLICLAGWIALGLLGRDGKSPAYEAHRSPFDLTEVAKFALLLATLTVLAQLAARLFGEAGLEAFAASAGLVDVDAVTLAIVKLEGTGLGDAVAVSAILIGVASNQVFKLVLSFIGGRPLGLTMSGVFVLAAGAAVLVQVWR